jgi:hypothetical protein
MASDDPNSPDGPFLAKVDAQGRVYANMEDLNRIRDGWALAIGRFLVAFAGCEFWTYVLIRNHGSKDEAAAVDDQPLWKRLSVLEAVFLRLRLVPEIRERAANAVAGIRKHTGTRNILAHNAPMVHVYRNEADGAMEIRHELRSARDSSKGVSVEQLEREAAALAEVEEEFAILMGALRQERSRLKERPL